MKTAYKNILKFLVVAAIAGYVIRNNASEVELAWDGFRHIGAGVACAVVLLLFVFTLIISIRQRVLLRPFPVSVSLRKMWLITYAGLFGSNLLPAGTGLDLVRFLCMRDGKSFRAPEVSAFIIVDKLVGLCGLLLLAAMVLCAGYFLENSFLGGDAKVLRISLALFGICALAVVAFCLAQVRAVHDLLMRVARRLPLKGFTVGLLNAVGLYRREAGSMVIGLGLAVAGHLCCVIAIAILSETLQTEGSFWVTMVCSPLVLLSSIVPMTPGNIGWTESAATIVWSFFDAKGGLAVFLLWRISLLLFSLGGSVAWLGLGKEQCAE